MAVRAAPDGGGVRIEDTSTAPGRGQHSDMLLVRILCICHKCCVSSSLSYTCTSPSRNRFSHPLPSPLLLPERTADGLLAPESLPKCPLMPPPALHTYLIITIEKQALVRILVTRAKNEKRKHLQTWSTTAARGRGTRRLSFMSHLCSICRTVLDIDTCLLHPDQK